MFWPFVKYDPSADLAAAQKHLIARRFAKAARLFRRHADIVAKDPRLSLAHARAEMLQDNDRRAWRLFRQAIDLAAERGEEREAVTAGACAMRGDARQTTHFRHTS